jgi:hypothetical protein
MQCRKDAVTIFSPSSSVVLQSRTIASSRVEDTPQKCDSLSSLEQMNSDSDERPGGSYSPTVLCAQAMGWEGSCAASCVLSVSQPKGQIQTGLSIGLLG